MKVLFLDIDGVLNTLAFDDVSKSHTFDAGCVGHLNRVVSKTGCRIVVSSSWRYMVLGEAMTLRGFQYMLRTHGVVDVPLAGVTCSDEQITGRGEQIAGWLNRHPEVTSFACVDDEEYDSPVYVKRRLVLTDGSIGMRNVQASQLICMLNGECV